VVDEDATSTVLDSSPNPSVAGETVAVRVHVETSHSGGRKPTGAVSLSVDGTPQSLALDASGAAAVDLSALSAGTHTLGARYAGDGDFLGSDATPITQTVVLAATTTTLAASRTSAVFGQPIDVTVKVRAEGPHVGTPAGTVNFTVDGASQAVALDASGSAALSLSLAVGAHTIGASYSGDAGFAASDAGSLSLVVTQAETRTTLSSSANPATSGAAITFSAAVKATGAGSGSPSGTVTFRDGAAVLGSAALDTSGTALLTAPSLAVGSHSITAAYSGDASFAASASAALTETVKAGKY
jgi:hypothetical protein